jgi:predicted DsbA family dithiol-disulfide isomerase
VAEALFLSYFTEGRDVGDRGVLTEIAAGAGLDRSEVDSFLGGDQGVPDVRGEEERGKSLGIDGVPFFLIDGQVALSGAQEPEMIRKAIERTVGRKAD